MVGRRVDVRGVQGLQSQYLKGEKDMSEIIENMGTDNEKEKKNSRDKKSVIAIIIIAAVIVVATLLITVLVVDDFNTPADLFRFIAKQF